MDGVVNGVMHGVTGDIIAQRTICSPLMTALGRLTRSATHGV